MKRITRILLTLSLFAGHSAMAQVKDSTVTSIYTDFKSYWTSSTTKNNSVLPDSSHNLLAFTFRGKTYSTGVNNTVLDTKLGSANYTKATYKALPIRNIEGTVIAGGATNLAFALKDDGDSTKAAYKSPYPNIHIADLLTDGKNGLDLGTGVTNVPKGGHISFTIKNIGAGAVTDSTPDFVFTQIAEPTTNQPDTIYFYDENNNVVGNKKLVYWNTVTKLGTYKLDLYTLTPGQACNTAIMNGIFEQNGTRDIRMVAFLLSEFGITSTEISAKIKGIQINPSGSSDQAFIAYNINNVNLEVPSITAQPATQNFCSPQSTSSVTFSVSATSATVMTYQWKKNGAIIDGATSSSYTAAGLTIADTANAYSVTVTNNIGAITSDNAYVKYYITSQPSSLYLATGNAASFIVKTSGATAWQWQKNSTNISGATSVSYALPVVNQADSGSYQAVVSYNGGTCTSDAATLKTSIVLYSKSSGNLNLPATWGVATDGSGSTPVDFTRDEHTFIVANRTAISTAADVTIAGTLDVANGKVTITPGTTLTVGRSIRSASLTGANSGSFIASPTSSLSLTGISTAAYSGASNLYFDASNNTLKNLTIASHTVTLNSALNITAGFAAGVVIVSSGTLATSDLLTLKSDVNGTASIGSSAGTISGKVTIEKYIHARRAWRLMGAPVSSTNAPTINAAWQEGATSSTANPNPGYGTHITYGPESDGFDQNPQKTFSMKIRDNSGNWVGTPSTNKTAITNYPAYFIFIRGNRSYDILSTTNVTTPTTTIIRVTGNVNQGAQTANAVTAAGYTLVSNPYACPVNFTKLVKSNVKARIRVWDPTLAGAKGVGAWVVLDGTSGTYKATPSSTNVSTLLQAGQGFLIESNDGVNSGSLSFTENAKDLSGATLGADRVGEVSGDTSLAINLKLFNPDSTTAIADGVLFNFNATNNDSVDNDDAAKLNNFGENLGIKEGSSLLTISDRKMPKEGDSLHLNLIARNASYQMEFVPSSLENQSFSLYDKYLNTFAPISATDTTRITFSVNTSVDASKAADRFVIITNKAKLNTTVLPIAGITSIKATAKDKAISVEWNVSNESGVAYYEVQKSSDANVFTAAGTVAATGAASYSYSDVKPSAGVNYYRVKNVSKTGAISYTNIVNAQLSSVSASGIASVGVYPNPLTGTSFTLTLNNLSAGAYTLSIVNGNGITQFTKAIQHNGGTASQKVSLNSALAAGIYYVKVTSAEGSVNMVKIIAQ